MQALSKNVCTKKSFVSITISFSNWLLIAVILSLSSSCRTKLVPSTIQEQYYTIDYNIIADTMILNYYKPYKEKLDAEMNRVIGFSNQHLSKPAIPETLVGNFFVDALLWKGKKLDSETQLSFATKGGIRSDLRQGKVTVGNIFEVMPFENKISILTLRGEDVIRLGDFLVKTNGQPIAGAKLIVENGEIKTFTINGKPIDPALTYKLVTYDYLANGGDYIDFFDRLIERKDYEQPVRDALIEYVQSITNIGENIDVKLDGRIQITNE
ncbi:5'-nucleotidase [Sphingobacterium sp. UT-1RO-CII-1]|uniref:5'-nucleotidase C-terminal domain-containing protein n=1 Tax=Sphingobacterium sp. UT-1RO-CII-1 TaxID=2995225 RepID=UPI00227AF1DE|nr:5'-nucleotidase [Sphingobacterium sp. UT-1RO-CII-1]MCY4778943.1 5'-nucleotidase [Sphingobacterium sp. UT-1RO-CII-1]